MVANDRPTIHLREIFGDDDPIIQTYTGGQCHAFALALQAVIGGDLVWVGDSQCNGEQSEFDGEPCSDEEGDLPEALIEMKDADCFCQVQHVMVKVGDDFFDIEGVHDEISLTSGLHDLAWGHLTNEEAKALGSLSTWLTPDIKSASLIVKDYLTIINLS